MPRKPKISTSHPAYTTQKPNAFVNVFGTTLTSEILPSADVRQFEASQAPLYVKERYSGGDTDPGEEDLLPSYHHEEQFDSLFWSHPAKTLFVEGAVGSGKSTFIDYYLRSFCPFQGVNGKDFELKLIISIDFRNTPTPDDFRRLMYKKARKVIQRECSHRQWHIETVDNFDMWEPIHQFSGPVFAEAADASGCDPTDHAFRAKYVNDRKLSVSDELWVEAAITFLTSKRHSGQCPFGYLVFVFDNLDQSDEHVLEAALFVIRQWTSDPAMRAVWRIIVPVWPRTLDFMADLLEPRQYGKFLMSPPAIGRVLALRDGSISDSTNPELKGFIADCQSQSSEHFNKLLRGLAAGSTRASLEMWNLALSNSALYRAYEERKANYAESLQLGTYYMVDALLRGQYDVYHRDGHPVLNLVDLLGERGSDRDALIGFHVLTLLRAGVGDQPELEATLGRLGYRGESVRLALQRFISQRLFRPLRRGIQISHGALNAYYDLFANPRSAIAYLDNMALVVPVEEARLNRITFVKPEDRYLFFSRRLSSIVLLEEIRDVEASFVARSTLPNGLSYEMFAKELNSRRMPSLFLLWGHSVLDNLEFLKERFRTLATDDEWYQLLNHRVLSAVRTGRQNNFWLQAVQDAR